MTLRINTRGIRAATTMLACAGLALSPAVANAAAKKTGKKHAATLKEAKKPTGTVKFVAKAPTSTDTGLGDRMELGSTTQLAAMNTAIKAAPTYFTGRSTGCARVTAMLTSQSSAIMAGNFRDGDGYCYVWLNLDQSQYLTGSEICKTTLHEMGHLSGLQHSADENDVMFAPFQSDPIPAPCVAQPPASKAKAKAKNASASVCPPGAANADYCQVVKSAKKKSVAKKRSRR
jgi:hypothetical protein